MSRVHQHFTINEHGRDFIVGDIHGCFEALSLKLDDLGFDPTKDRLFCVGDLVDRGPSSTEALAWLDKPWFHTVRGNHEQLTIDAYYGDRSDRELHAMNGGAWFVARTPLERREIVAAFEELPYAISVGDIGIVHAEVLHNTWGGFLKDLEDNDRTRVSAIWGRHRVTYREDKFVEGIARIYVGHTVILPETELVIGNHHYIDTGGCFSEGFLTVVPL